MEGLEKRNPDSKRIDVVRPVAVFAEGREGIIRGKTRNISNGGCSINLDDVLEIGEKVLFRIDLGEEFDPAVQSARVVWSDKGAVGVKFTNDKLDVPKPAEKKEELPACGSVVKLNIEKMDKPLRVVCKEATSESMVLRTSIPFLETAKKVTIHFQDTSGSDRQLRGMLTDVALEKVDGENVPCINLLVERDVKPDAEGKREILPPPVPEKRVAAAPKKKTEEKKEEKLKQQEASEPPAEEPSAESVEEPGFEAPDEIQETQRAVSTATYEQMFDSMEEETIQDTFDEKITPKYVIVIQTIVKWIVWLAIKAKTGLGPWVRKALPVVKKVCAAALKYIKAAVAAVYHEIAVLFRRGRRQRKTMRKTKLTMRRQVPRSRAIIGGLKSVKWQALLLVVTLFAFTAGIWGLVNLFKSNNDNLPEQPAEALPHVTAPQGSQGSAKVNEASYDLWGDSGGANVSNVKMKTEAVAAAKAPEPEKQVKNEETAADKPDEDKSNTQTATDGAEEQKEASSAPPPAKEKEEPIVVDNTVRLYVKGEIYGFKHYALAQPPGIVVDVKGAQPTLPEGRKDLKGTKAKYLKTLQREDGTRFILIFHGKSIPEFELIAHSDRIVVKFI